jgi:glycerol-3-phosphate cytidylyltransferase
LKTVITYGTFDLFHVGHVRLLKRLRALGDRLVVGLSTDEFNKIKGKETVVSYTHRKEIVSAIAYVDSVFPEHNWDQKLDDIRREKADIFAMGDDWAGKFDDLADHVSVIYVPRTPHVSSTDLKNVLAARHRDRVQAILHAVNHVELLVSEML